ncbi:hypothetical protein CFter6_2857 [Collimonas fungivorans]|uniref:Uncharacterized protein n=1 Tax=Collimonas fungivorans TaxID=158899 RepID=A0A127PCU3_9BURK|nr:hypothetical protein CFter6_2857 [Collimonas fungivorans]
MRGTLKCLRLSANDYMLSKNVVNGAYEECQEDAAEYGQSHP